MSTFFGFQPSNRVSFETLLDGAIELSAIRIALDTFAVSMLRLQHGAAFSIMILMIDKIYESERMSHEKEDL